MADQIYKVVDPSGKVREISGPSGATDDEIIAQAKLLFQPVEQEKLTPEQVHQKYLAAKQQAEKSQLSPVEQYLATKNIPQPLVDIAAGASGTMRGTANILGKAFGEEKLGEKIWPSFVARDSGYRTLGAVLDPAALAVGGAGMKVAGMLPKLSPYAQGIAGGALGGGAIGALSEQGNIGEGAMLGGAISAALPPVLKGATALASYPYHLIERFLPGGKEQIAGRAMIKAAGEKTEPIISALKRAPKGVTAGQAATDVGSAEFSALQEKIKQFKPSEYDAIKQAQEAERLSLLRSIGKDAPSKEEAKTYLDLAVNTRKSIADRLYGDAFAADDMRIANLQQQAQKMKGGIAQATPSPIPLDPRVENLTKNSTLSNIADEITNNTPELGNPFASLRGLDRMKKLIDEDLLAIKNKQPTAIKNATEASLTGAKAQLVNSMEKLSPAYNKARTIYSEKSLPINQIMVGQMLEDALSSTIGVAERGTVFANKVKDASKIITKMTGQTRYEKLSDLFTPEQMGKVNKVIADINRDARLKELAMQGMPKITKQISDTSHEIKPIGLLDRAWTIANAALRRIQGTAGEKSLQEISTIMQNPEQTAQIMQKATIKEKNALKLIQNMQQKAPYAAIPVISAIEQGKQQ